MVLFSVQLPMRWSEFSAVQIAIGVALAAGSITGWFRAEALVRNRTLRPGFTSSRRGAKQMRASNWKRCGAMRFFSARFGSVIALVFLFILVCSWIFSDLFSSFRGSVRGSAGFNQVQINMFLPIMTFAIAQVGAVAGEHLGVKFGTRWLWASLIATFAIAAIWFSTYRLLATPHPWRAGFLKMPGMQPKT